MPTAQHLRLRCFLEGIEVPIVSASLSIQPDSPAQCQIQIPATDRAHDLLPRTLVHVFYYDYHDGPGDTLSVRVGNEDQVLAARRLAEMLNESENAGNVQPNTQTGDTTTSGSVATRTTFAEDLPGLTGISLDPAGAQLPSEGASPTAAARVESSQIRQDESDDPLRDEQVNDQNWRLFFCGEVIGYQFVKSYNNRGIILDCMDLSIYWDTCYQYKVNVASLTGNAMANFVGAGTSLWDVFFQSATSSLVDIVTRRSYSRPDLTGLLSGIVHLLERVGGVYTSPGRSFRGVNDFFSIAELRLHLVDMICASENDNSSRQMFARRAYNAWTRREGGQLGEIASFREILNLVNRYIFHNVIPCPIAKYEPPDQIATSRSVRYNIADTPEGRRWLGYARELYSSAVVGRTAWAAQTGAGAPTAELDRSVTAVFAGVANGCEQVLIPALNRLGARAAASKAVTARQKANLVSSYITTGPSAQMVSELTTLMDDVITALDECISALTGLPPRSRNVSNTRRVSARLNSQIMRPDIFMVAPPRCNVIFPELYSSMQFSRQFLREVTRMRLTVSDEIFGPDMLLDNWYYAPDVEVLGERVRQGTTDTGGIAEGATLQRAAYSCRLMDHELFTGVVPVFERMNEVNMYAARAQMVTRRGAVVPYAMRAAHFQFFKNRMAPRSMSVSGKFNPYIAPGFPAAVIDRYMTKEGIEMANLRGIDLLGQSLTRGWARVIEDRREYDRHVGNDEFSPMDVWIALRNTVPVQFTGLLMAVQHNVSQSSAGTSYTLSTARTHRDRDELLGSNVMQVARRQPAQTTRTSFVAALEGDPPLVGQLGPYYGLITNVVSVSRTGSFLLFGTFSGGRPRREVVRVPVGITQPARSYGPEVVGMVGSRDAQVTFQAYQVTEEVDRWRGQHVEVPMEDFLRPPWMSDVWASDRIGGVYQQFFGTGALTDPMVIDTGTARATYTEDYDETHNEAGARNQTVQDPIRADGTTNQTADLDITIERAIDLLVKSYSEIRQAGLDVHEFIRAYTWRPVATIDDMLGTRDLEMDPATGRVLRGVEGFHSRAFGRGETGSNLRNLVPENMAGTNASEQEEDRYHIAARLLGIGTGANQDRRNLLTRLDKRADKSAAVLAYVQELWDSRGQLG